MGPDENDLTTNCIVFQDCEFSVRVSFLEIYNEELFDLLSLNMDNQKLRLFEDSTRKVRLITLCCQETSVSCTNARFRIMTH